MSKLITIMARPDKNFKTIKLQCVNDKNLTWKAKGIHTYLITRPPKWAVNINDLINRSKEGKTALYTGICELIAAKYVFRIVKRNLKRRIEGWGYIVLENPSNEENLKNELDEGWEFSNDIEDNGKRKHAGKSDHLDIDNQDIDNQFIENQTIYINSNINSKEINSSKILNNSFLKKTRGQENEVFLSRQLSENKPEINDSNFLTSQEPASAAKDTFTETDQVQVLETKPLTETGDVTMDPNFLIQQKQDSLTKQSGSDQLFDRPKSPANQPTGWERPFNRKECRKGCKELADAESEKESEIKIPKKVQEIISHWELQEIDSKKLYVPKKQFWKTTKKFVKDLNELLKNQDIEDVKVAIERFAIAALDENFAPRNKEKYSKYSIKDFFFGKYRNNGELTNLDLLNKYLSAPPKPIETTPENKYPSIVKTLKKRYDIEIMKNIRALIPCDGTEEMKMYIECSHNLIAFFERIENRTGYLGTYEMADLLFDAVLYSVGTNDPMIFTVKTLCLGRSKEIWEGRLLKYLTHLRYIDNNESNNTFSIYGDKYKDIEILNKAVKQEAEKRLEQLESEGVEPVYDDEDEGSFEEDQAKNPWREDIPLEEQYDQEDLNKLAILYDDMSLYRDISFPKIVKQTEPEPVERQPVIPKWRLEQQKIDGWVALYEKKEAEKIGQRNSVNKS